MHCFLVVSEEWLNGQFYFQSEDQAKQLKATTIGKEHKNISFLVIIDPVEQLCALLTAGQLENVSCENIIENFAVELVEFV